MGLKKFMMKIDLMLIIIIVNSIDIMNFSSLSNGQIERLCRTVDKNETNILDDDNFMSIIEQNNDNRIRFYSSQCVDLDIYTSKKFTYIDAYVIENYLIVYIGQNTNRVVSGKEKKEKIFQWATNISKSPLILRENNPYFMFTINVPRKEDYEKSYLDNDYGADDVEHDQRNINEQIRKGEINLNATIANMHSSISKMFHNEKEKFIGFQISNKRILLEQIKLFLKTDERHKLTSLIINAYVIVCFRINDESLGFKGCKTRVVDSLVSCDCSDIDFEITPNLIPICVMGIHFLFCTVVLLIFNICKRKNNDIYITSEQVIYVLCSPKNILYKYDIVFRIGCPSPDFDMVNTVIEFEFFAPPRQSICIGRIQPRHLMEEEIAEIHFVMNRLTPILPSSLSEIRFVHTNGNPKSVIYFYGFNINEYNSDNFLFFPIKTSIGSTNKFKKIKQSTDLTEPIVSATDTPKLPKTKTNFQEKLIIYLCLMNLISLITFILVRTKESEKSISTYFIILIDFIVGSIIYIVIAGVFLFTKRKEAKVRFIYGEDTSKLTLRMNIYLLVMLILSFIFAIIISIKGMRADLPSTVKFFTIVFFVMNLLILFAVIIQYFDLFKYILTRDQLYHTTFENILMFNSKSTIESKTSSINLSKKSPISKENNGKQQIDPKNQQKSNSS